MTRLLAIPALLFTMGVLCPSTGSAADITYFVEPFTLTEGYTIDRGHITTNGALGPLTGSDILDYEVVVNGPFPYLFSPSNPSSSIISSANGVVASELEIGIESIGSLNTLRFSAEDNTRPDCQDCSQFIRWAFLPAIPVDPAFRGVAYRVIDGLDGAPDVIANVNPGPPRILVAGTSLVGDFDSSGFLDAVDIDLLTEAIRDGSTDLTFDLDGSTVVDSGDVTYMVETRLGTDFGDANLDRIVTASGDGAILLSNLGGVQGSKGWADADFDGDQNVTASEDGGILIAALSADTAAVPEPSTLLLSLLGVCAVGCAARRMKRVAGRS